MINPSFHLRYPFFGEGGVPPGMIQLSKNGWEIAGGVAALAVLGAAAVMFLKRKRPTEDELEQERRQMLVQLGRIVDGMLEDIHELDGEDGSPVKLLFFSYRIGGVDYECSQDITRLQDVLNPAQIRIGFPCSVRYQPGNPQNSIVVSETWSGLREGFTQIHPHGGSESTDASHRQQSH